jgi:hypothetical protein
LVSLLHRRRIARNSRRGPLHNALIQGRRNQLIFIMRAEESEYTLSPVQVLAGTVHVEGTYARIPWRRGDACTPPLLPLKEDKPARLRRPITRDSMYAGKH